MSMDHFVTSLLRHYCTHTPAQTHLLTYPLSLSLPRTHTRTHAHICVPHASQVFDRDSTQEQVFEEISQLVQSSLDGYNVCVFAYGQTGSGKTYTMLGGDDADARGMIPRAVEQV